VEYELADRLAVGVMVFNLMRLPRLFPRFEFDIKYFRRLPAYAEAAGGSGR